MKEFIENKFMKEFIEEKNVFTIWRFNLTIKMI